MFLSEKPTLGDYSHYSFYKCFYLFFTQASLNLTSILKVDIVL